ncbi:MAG TPA: helix-turn-helix domain-containing protein [Candidatus Thermoplasmatota archaeon]|nr:helix-turn-helix domain-containing protein [Candidatus Thermoplasmatota archaeon]
MPQRDRLLTDLPHPVELARMRQEVMQQKEMAALIGVDRGQLSRFEAGKGEMSYEKIRKYVHVLNLRRAASDPRRFLLDRIITRGPLWEAKPADPLDRALEAMVLYEANAIPVLTASGDDYLGVLTEASACEALVEEDLARSLVRPVGTLRLEPLDRVRPGDPLQRVAALLSSHALVLVEDDDGLPAGFAMRADLFPLLLGQTPRAPASPTGRRRRK